MTYLDYNATAPVKPAVIEAMREGLASWQAQRIDIPECRGYGMFYGATYGE